MHGLIHVLAHPGHPEIVTDEGGHAAMGLAIAAVVIVLATALTLLARRISSARRGASA